MMACRALAGCVVALLLVSVPMTAVATVNGNDDVDTARVQIQRMVDAADAIGFRGLLVHVQGDHIESLELVRWIDNGVQERIHTLRGPEREVLRHESGMRWAMPDRGVVVHDQRPRPQGRFTSISRDQLAVLDDLYTLEHGGLDRVAGREAHVIGLIPRDGYRYSYRLWVDAETGLLLASQCLSEDDTVIEQFMFVQLDFDPDEQAREPVIAIDGLAEVTGHDAEPVASRESPRWHADNLPPGFTLLRHGRRPAPGGVFDVDFLLYGDGFAAVSVYIAPGENLDFTGYSRHGATRIAATTIDGHHVTLVGEVPKQTLERLLTGLKPVTD